MKETVNNFIVMYSTSTTLCVRFTDKIRLVGQRHSDRRSGASVWEVWFEKYGKWKHHDNPFDKKDITVVEEWGRISGSMFRGVKLAKHWTYKKDIIEAINSVPIEK